MLTKRANLLFDQSQWADLLSLAKLKGTTVSGLIRQALNKTYFSDLKLAKRRETIDAILKIRKISPVKLDYEEMINYGRER